MLEKMLSFITGTNRILNVDVPQDEPSHIHLPRRRRVARTAEARDGTAWDASVMDQDAGAAPLTLEDRQPAECRR
jgi:hypothetical protein